MRPALVRHRHAAHLDVDHAAARAGRGRLELDRLAGDRALVQLEQALALLGQDHDQLIAADDLLATQPRGLEERGVHVDHAVVRVAQHERVGDGVEDRAVLFLARAQVGVRAAAFDLGARDRERRFAKSVFHRGPRQPETNM